MSRKHYIHNWHILARHVSFWCQRMIYCRPSQWPPCKYYQVSIQTTNCTSQADKKHRLKHTNRTVITSAKCMNKLIIVGLIPLSYWFFLTISVQKIFLQAAVISSPDYLVYQDVLPHQAAEWRKYRSWPSMIQIKVCFMFKPSAEQMSIEPLGITDSAIWIGIRNSSFKKMLWKISFEKYRTFRSGLCLLMIGRNIKRNIDA